MIQPGEDKITTDDLTGHDHELISKWTGTYLGHPDADVMRQHRALYTIGRRKLGIDRQGKYESTGGVLMKDILAWNDAHWAPTDAELAAREAANADGESLDDVPPFETGPNSGTP